MQKKTRTNVKQNQLYAWLICKNSFVHQVTFRTVRILPCSSITAECSYLPLSCGRFWLLLVGKSSVCFDAAIGNKLFENLMKSWLIVNSCTQYTVDDHIHVSLIFHIGSFQILQLFIRPWNLTTYVYTCNNFKFHRYLSMGSCWMPHSLQSTCSDQI